MYDIAVIGAGVVGASAAYFAAGLGASVALIDRGWPGQQGSGRNAGGVRQQGRLPAELPLAMHSIGLWERFRDELGGQIEYVQDGNLYLALNEAEMALLKSAALRQREAGLDVRFLTAPEVQEVAPALSERVVAANYCPRDGVTNPILATRFVLRLAVSAGARLFAQTAATGIETAAGHRWRSPPPGAAWSAGRSFWPPEHGRRTWPAAPRSWPPPLSRRCCGISSVAIPSTCARPRPET